TADYPVSDPIGGDNIAYVSHIYPGHWLDEYWGPSYMNEITTCAALHPVFMTEWGFSMTSGESALEGTISEYGQPLMDFVEGLKISHSGWVASYDWGPPMFNTDWTLRCGEGEMGCFIKDTLYARRNDDQPGAGDDITAPTAPTSLVATPGDGTVSLDWDINTEGDLDGYNVYRSTTSGSGYSQINSELLVSSDYVDPNATNDVTYYYVVTAVDTSSNESGYSNEDFATPTDMTPPVPPTSLAATAGDGTVSLDWDDNSEIDLDGYNIYRSTTSGSGYSQINGVQLSSSDYTDNSVTNGVTYYYVVTAVDTSSNESGNSNENSAMPADTTPPTPPTGLMATTGNGYVSLFWLDNTEIDLDGYHIYRSTASGSGYTQLNGSLLSSPEYLDPNVTDSVTYFYVVTAMDTALNESGYSSEESVMAIYDPNYIDGDFNDDDKVDILDLELLVLNWLRDDCFTSQDCNEVDIAPLGGDHTVNMLDFSAMIEDWLMGVEMDSDPPVPNPLTWDLEPAATGMYSIDMSATEATDESGVEYYFYNVTDPTHDSGWQVSPYYEDTGLAMDTSYTYEVRARDTSPKRNKTDFSQQRTATTDQDTFPPDPNPMTWAQAPQATGTDSITMTAATASDDSGFEYYFNNVTDPNHDSGWQDSTYYEDTGLTIDTTYTYQVKARDKSPNQNETAYSEQLSATTEDTVPPTPNPLTWAQAPQATGTDSIIMTATTATDDSEIEYYFNNVTEPTHDSGWQNSPVYEDTDLDADTSYTYQVKARDLSLNLNETAYSIQSSANTQSSNPAVETEETFYSIGSEDGRMWDNGSIRGLDNEDQEDHENEALRLGDYAAYTYRCILSFDTSFLPDDSEITSIQLEMTRGFKPASGTDPFTWGGNCLIDVVNPCFGSSPALDNDDWDWPADADAVAEFLADPGENNQMTSTEFDQNGRNSINLSGKTQLRVYFTNPTNGDSTYDYLGFYSGNYSDASLRPRLIITYNTRTPPVTFTSMGGEDGRVWDDGDGLGDGSNSDDNSNAALRLGDILYSGTSLAYQAILSFDTSGLPDDKVIVSARLELTRGLTEYSVDPFTWGGSCTVDIVSGYFGDSVILEQTDWEASSDAAAVAGFASDPGSEAAMMSSYFNTEGLNYINKTGSTQIKVYFTIPTNNGSTDFLGIYSGDHGDPLKHPRLIVRYSID
ncbi:MAG: hypothetical protein JW860_10775, partial [Sedimentisphaerales bacterium]|nr:hypothetical protein [Sedimentisphaerales bacterium]